MRILQSMKKGISLLAVMSCTTSLWVPGHLAAEPYAAGPYAPGDDCCEYQECKPRWFTVKDAVILGVAAGLGAAAGALVHHKNGHGGEDGDRGRRGRRGERGATGATGPAGIGFIADLGQTLTFSLAALFPASPPNSISVTPFITDPSGRTFEGQPVFIQNGTNTFGPVVIPNPIFGTYNVGLLIANTGGAAIAGITLNGSTALASRDNVTTTELAPLAGVLVGPGESQITTTFTYIQNP